jgi:ABC-type dipeptide/oligopeptide/nickel transport system permease subunit
MSLVIGIATATIGTVVGGARPSAGYYRGKTDGLITGGADVLLAFRRSCYHRHHVLLGTRPQRSSSR